MARISEGFDFSRAIMEALMASARGDYQEVVAVLSPLLKTKLCTAEREQAGLWSRGYSLLAMSLAKLGRIEEALEAIDRAMGGAPGDLEDMDATLKLRRLILEQVLHKRLSTTLDEFRDAGAAATLPAIKTLIQTAASEEIHNVEVDARRARACMLGTLHRTTEALDELDRAIAIVPAIDKVTVAQLSQERAELQRLATIVRYEERSREIVSALEQGDVKVAEAAARVLVAEAADEDEPEPGIVSQMVLAKLLLVDKRPTAAMRSAYTAWRQAHEANSERYLATSRGLLLAAISDALDTANGESPLDASTRIDMLVEAAEAARALQAPGVEGTILFPLVKARLSTGDITPALAEAERLVALVIAHAPHLRDPAEHLLQRARQLEELSTVWMARLRQIVEAAYPGDASALAALRVMASDLASAPPEIRAIVEPTLAKLLVQFGDTQTGTELQLRTLNSLMTAGAPPEVQIAISSGFAASLKASPLHAAGREAEVGSVARAATSAAPPATTPEIPSTITELEPASSDGESRDCPVASEIWSSSSCIGEDIIIEALIGRGGMGEVYRAHLRGSREPVAVKRVLPDRVGEGEREAFEQELVAWLDLPPHPNLVQCRYFRTLPSGDIIIVADFVEGETLAEHVYRHGALDMRDALDVGMQLILALAAVHSRGKIHRDVKPQNVLITTDGVARLSDFGLTTGRSGATRRYAAPEQLDHGDVGPAADVFGWGATLLHAMLGETHWVDGATLAANPPVSLLQAEHPLYALLLASIAERPEARPDMGTLWARLTKLWEELVGMAYPRAVAPPATTSGRSDEDIIFENGEMPLGLDWWAHIVEELEGRHSTLQEHLDRSELTESRAAMADDLRAYRALLSRLVAVADQVPRARPWLARLLHEMATACREFGDLSGALEYAQRSVDVWSALDQPDALARARALLAETLSRAGRIRDAIELMRTAANTAKAPALRVRVAIRLGNLLSDTSAFAEAIDAYEQARAGIPTGGDDHWDSLRSIVFLELAILYRNIAQPERAIEQIDASLLTMDPTRGGRRVAQMNLAQRQYIRGTILADLGRHDPALQAYDTALELIREEPHLRAAKVRDQARLSRSISLMAKGHLDEANNALEEVVAQRRRWFEVEGRTEEGHTLAHALYMRGEVLMRLGRSDDAYAVWMDAYSIYQELIADGQFQHLVKPRIIPLMLKIGDHMYQTGQLGGAYVMLHQAVMQLDLEREHYAASFPTRLSAYDIELAGRFIQLGVLAGAGQGVPVDKRARESFADRALELLTELRGDSGAGYLVHLRFAQAAELKAQGLYQRKEHEAANCLLDEARVAALAAWNARVAHPAECASALLNVTSLRALRGNYEPQVVTHLLDALTYTDANLGDARARGLAHTWAMAWAIHSRLAREHGDLERSVYSFDRAEAIWAEAIDAGEVHLMQEFMTLSNDFISFNLNGGSRPHATRAIRRYLRRLESWIPKFDRSNLAELYDQYVDHFANYL